MIKCSLFDFLVISLPPAAAGVIISPVALLEGDEGSESIV